MSQEEMLAQNKSKPQGESSEDDDEIKIKSPKRFSAFKGRLLKRDRSRFDKYIQSTTTHGVVYIFIGKSRIRRLFWLLIVLTAAVGCLYNVINRIIFLANVPESTTISVKELDKVDFPAVTLCNLNLVKKSYLDQLSVNLGKVIRGAYYTQGAESECNAALENFDVNDLPQNESFSDLIWQGRHTAEETIFNCRIMGRECNSSDFIPTLTPSGVCYTFNGGRDEPILKTNGTGTRHALSFLVSVIQHEYSVAQNHDAGIKIAVHPQSEPPQPDELGIAVAPGKNAFISVRQTNVENKSSKRRCKDASDTTSFNFLQGEFPYSVSACQIDCLRSNIVRNCNCLGAGMAQSISTKSKFYTLRNCTVNDICCQITEMTHTSPCDCQNACSKTLYTTSASYSEFPANYAARDLVNSFFNISFDAAIFKENFLSVNIYFETLTVEEQITSNAYGVVALLSDIGGQLGLFLGASVISVLEFLTWLVDETKDRCFGLSERKITSKVKSLTAAAKGIHKHKQAKQTNNKGQVINTANQGVDDYREFETLLQ